jgi:predicted metal-dependent phosphoesterase TrpH
VAWTRERGGVVVLPHPFGRLATERVRQPNLARAAELVDAVEGLNARNDWAPGDVQALELAARFGKPLTAGSDAHLPGELGSGYLLIEPFADAREFLANLPGAQPALHRRRLLTENVLGVARIVLTRAAWAAQARLNRDAGQ